MKLVLGTVQFGMPYGINNAKGMPSNEDIKSILDYALQHNIKHIDTAALYGDAEEKIGSYSKTPFHIITKFPYLSTQEELMSSFKNSLRHLKCEHVFAYMAHNATTFMDFPDVWDHLQNLKLESLVEKIGYSIYTVEQLEKLLNKNFIPDLIQLPYSVLDRKFEPYFKNLKQYGTTIHVRSVFLQGLYFMNLDLIPERLTPLKTELLMLHHLSEEYGISLQDLVLNYVYENEYIDGVLIGIDTLPQLVENINSIQNWKSNMTLRTQLNKIEAKHPELLNPSNW